MTSVQAVKIEKERCCSMAESLAHSKWVCKYHIVFSPKYRRKIIYNQLRADIQQYIRDLCKWKGVEILEGHMMPDHVHLLLSIPPKYCVFSFMGYLKGKSAMMIFEKHGNLKYKFGNRHFWATGYYWDVTSAPNFSNPHEHWNLGVFSKKFISGKRAEISFLF